MIAAARIVKAPKEKIFSFVLLLEHKAKTQDRSALEANLAARIG